MSASNARPCRGNRTSMSPTDPLSTLPDDIVSDILSRLPTEEVMETSFVSRTWRSKWTSIYNFDFDDDRRESNMVSFVNFVNSVLFRTSLSIRRFSLLCDKKYDPRYLETWISVVLMRNVEFLTIHAPDVKLDSAWCFQNWSSLKELELLMNCTLVIPFDNIFPNLKRLILMGGSFGGIKLVPRRVSSKGGIILNFPLVEVVSVGCEWMGVNFVEIHAPRFNTFEGLCIGESKDYGIRIFGPNLAKFTLFSGYANNYDLHGSPAISSVELYCAGETVLMRAYKVLQQLPNLKCLTLSDLLLELLVPSRSQLVFPTFKRLKKLEVRYSSCIKDLVEVLQLLPPLEVLSLNMLGWDDNCKTVQPWPPKIVSNLKKVRLEECFGYTIHIAFAEFILQNAKHLGEMVVIVGVSDAMVMDVKAANVILSDLLPFKNPSCLLIVV